MKYHITENEISYKLYGDRKEEVICILVGLSFWAISWYLVRYEPDIVDETDAVLVILGALAIFIGVFRMLAYSFLRIIFDTGTRCVYKKQPWGSRWRVVPFDHVSGFSITSECWHFHYCLARKNERFGRGIRISNDFRSSRKRCKDRRLFEDEILPAIAEMMESEK